MYRTTNKILGYILVFISTSVFSSKLAPIEINLEPNKPIILANTNPQKINVMCEVHIVTDIKHYISIQIQNGKGVFNGTSFKKGDSMVAALNHLQLIPLVADPGTKAQVTNLGANIIKATCS
jgi:hypothetical protein